MRGGGNFSTIKEGFEYALLNGIDEVIILPGTYDLVAEGIEDYSLSIYNNPNLKQGYYAPKKIIGYGAVLLCELSSPNWELSPINLYFGSNGTEIYGLTIICSNCRYCIHDEMWDMKAWGSNYYHNVFKDLTLVHKTAPSEILIAPTNIGGGFGEKGNITIENCVMQSAGAKNIDYHTKPASTGAQSGNCEVWVKDCVFNKTITGTRSGSSTDFINTIYVTNCLCGKKPTNRTDHNMRIISWNNEEAEIDDIVNTGINKIQVGINKDAYYNLQGHKVDSAYKGIVINQRKKFLKK